MEDFPSNSRKQKTESAQPKKVQKVVTGEVIRRKKPLGKRFSETFVRGDARGVSSYVMFDVLIPAAKDMVADAMSQGVERMLFGETRSASRRPSARTGGPSGYVSYNRYSTPAGAARREDPRMAHRRARAVHDFGDIVLATRAEAEEVIDRLYNLVATYESATVADLYELVGIEGDYTDAKWGWTDIRGSDRVIRVREGYLLDLPRPEPLD